MPPGMVVDDVDAVLARTKCPQCGNVDQPFHQRLARNLVLFALMLAIGCFVKACVEPSTVWLGGGVVGLVVVGALFWRGLTAATIVRGARVELSDEPVPVRQLVGATCVECRQRIVMAGTGTRCRTCKAPVHRKKCARSHAASAHGATESGNSST
jgi:hypothetical protein